MIILGLSAFFHDSSACLVKDGKLLAAVEEERFSRKKHDHGFPLKAVEYCLKEAGITIKDVDYIGFYEKPLMKFERILHQFVETFPRGWLAFCTTMPSWINEKLRVTGIIKRKLKFKGDIFFIDHHMAHAAAAFLVSPYDEAALLTLDGVGEWTTTTYGHGKGNDITLHKHIQFPHSLGLLYSALTAYLGFKVNNSEYKVMGLSAYGKPIYYDKLKKIIDVKDDGSFQLNMDYFVYHYKMSMPSKKFVEEFGPLRKRGEPVGQFHMDMAASLQKLTEDVVFSVLNHVYQETKTKNLCIGGGVALNSVANGKIINNTPFDHVYAVPSPGDGGTSIGAAYYVYNTLLGNKRNYVLNSPYLGPSFTSNEIKSFLDNYNIKYTTFMDDATMARSVAQLLNDNNVVGWFQGRMEFGPRALGGRSILANPTDTTMQDIINLKVKHRERFRPFAPAIMADKASEYFEYNPSMSHLSDFMLTVCPIKEDKRKGLPAVTHVDGTGRLQTVGKKQHPRYYEVIKAFYALSKTPILVNTSFNIRGEPIVCTPHEAYRCMMGTEIDYLVMDKFLIARVDNQQHAWDSEKYARD
jgi:carbamoyltransferase